MSKSTPERAAQNERTQKAEQLWLLYFNDVLLKNGYIDNCMHNSMRLRIIGRAKEVKKFASR